MSKIIDDNKEALLSLGFAFHGNTPAKSADPEKSIIDILPSFFEDRKLFRMLLTWLVVVSDLIHIERLNVLGEELPPNLKIVLGAIALKLKKTDRRWKLVHERLKSSLLDKGRDLHLPGEFNDPYLISKYGADEEFAELGVKISKILPENEKKILSLNGILKSNRWLRLRAVIGPNFRADVVYLYVADIASGPAEAARILLCSRDTAYRNWRALEEADVRKLIRLSA
jgi:hypothetical protein